MIICMRNDCYKKIPKSEIKDGWVSSKIAKPIPFELVDLKLTPDSPTLPGWWNRSFWDGYRVDNSLKYALWRRKVDTT